MAEKISEIELRSNSNPHVSNKQPPCKKSETNLWKIESDKNWRCCLNFFDLKCREDLPVNCQEPFINHGYRPNPSSLTYCLMSVFHPTNETGNVWTHAIPFVIMVQHYLSFVGLHVHDITDPLLYPYWFYSSGVIFTLFGSTCAHLFNCLSPGVREACFCCDYGVINLHSIGIACSFTFYICPYSCMSSMSGVTVMFYLIIMMGIIVNLAIACISRYPNIPYMNILRIIPYVAMFIILCVPCIYKYAILQPNFDNVTITVSTEYVTPTCSFSMSSTAVQYFRNTCTLFLLAIIFKGSKIPERWWPGKFDIIGHSHQIFHFLTALGLYFETLLVENSLKEIILLRKTEKLHPEHLEITWYTGLVIPGLFAFISCFITLYYSVDLHKCHSESDRKIE